MNTKIKLGLLTLSASLMIAFTIGLVVVSHSGLKTTYQEMGAATVMVVRSDGQSGGTGVILISSQAESYILTNKHVCGVVANGGTVVTDNGNEHNVVSYRESETHDLCLIKVAEDLHVHTDVASEMPLMYEKATVAGHPSLYPTIITEGHFSGKKTVEILQGIRPCTDEEKSGKYAMYCTFLGGIPLIKVLEAQHISATIKPGSSGSAVYNAAGEIAGLVFAGSGELGYGLIVPLEYINNFLHNELSTVEVKSPSAVRNAPAPIEAPNKSKRNCDSIKDEKVKDICKQLVRSFL